MKRERKPWDLNVDGESLMKREVARPRAVPAQPWPVSGKTGPCTKRLMTRDEFHEHFPDIDYPIEGAA